MNRYKNIGILKAILFILLLTGCKTLNTKDLICFIPSRVVGVDTVTMGYYWSFVSVNPFVEFPDTQKYFNYRETKIRMGFITERLKDTIFCNNYDTIVGNIEEIHVIRKAYINNTVKIDTVDSIMKFCVEYLDIDRTKETLPYKSMILCYGLICDLPDRNPINEGRAIVISAAVPPDSVFLQSYIIEYINSDGLKLIDSTKQFYLTEK